MMFDALNNTTTVVCFDSKWLSLFSVSRLTILYQHYQVIPLSSLNVYKCIDFATSLFLSLSLSLMHRYYITRAKLVSKVAKYPHVVSGMIIVIIIHSNLSLHVQD